MSNSAPQTGPEQTYNTEVEGITSPMSDNYSPPPPPYGYPPPTPPKKRHALWATNTAFPRQ